MKSVYEQHFSLFDYITKNIKNKYGLSISVSLVHIQFQVMKKTIGASYTYESCVFIRRHQNLEKIGVDFIHIDI